MRGRGTTAVACQMCVVKVDGAKSNTQQEYNETKRDEVLVANFELGALFSSDQLNSIHKGEYKF